MYILSQLKQTKGSGYIFYGVVPELVFGDPDDAKSALFSIITGDAGEDLDLTEDYEERFSSVIVYDKKVSMDAVAAALGDNPQIAARYYAKVFDSTILTEQMTAFK